jgi:Reverse transcriptase (RNA-dependent DNA polymerase)/zinc-binding in reverse transcriptase
MVFVMNEGLNGQLDKTFMDGTIVLVKKKTNDNSIKSYRPISLLNCDYKIFTRVIKSRMDELMPLIINNNQTSCNTGKNITSALCKLRDKIAELKHKRKNGILVSFDFDHAFDRVNHQFLLNILSKLNLNDRLILILKKIFQNSFSRILVNGQLSNEIKIATSVRQGDPLSMMLFVIYVNTLLDKLDEICNTHFTTLTAYADDITVIIDSNQKLDNIMQIFADFENASGARLNINKTFGLKIGNFRSPDWLNVKEQLKILGILFETNLRQAATNNWNSTVNKVRQLLWMHMNRDLNTIQKTILCNTFALSKIWYTAAIFPITKQHTAKIISCIGLFIWRGHALRVGFQQMTLPKNRGGLALIAPEPKANALFLSNFLKHSAPNPFVSQFMNISNPPHIHSMPQIPYLKNALLQLSYIPADEIQNPTPKSLYSFFTSRFPNVVPGRIQRNWTAIWKNILNKKLPSKTRSMWYIFLNDKLLLRSTLFNQGRVTSPDCPHCPGIIESTEHKYMRCVQSRHLWAYLLNHITNVTGRRENFGNLAYPEFENITRIEKEKLLNFFGIYMNIIENIPLANQSIQLLKFNLENTLYF